MVVVMVASKRVVGAPVRQGAARGWAWRSAGRAGPTRGGATPGRGAVVLGWFRWWWPWPRPSCRRAGAPGRRWRPAGTRVGRRAGRWPGLGEVLLLRRAQRVPLRVVEVAVGEGPEGLGSAGTGDRLVPDQPLGGGLRLRPQTHPGKVQQADRATGGGGLPHVDQLAAAEHPAQPTGRAGGEVRHHAVGDDPAHREVGGGGLHCGVAVRVTWFRSVRKTHQHGVDVGGGHGHEPPSGVDDASRRAALSRVGVESARGYASKGLADKGGQEEEEVVVRGSAGPTGDREMRSTMRWSGGAQWWCGGAGGGVSATRSPRRPALLVGMCGERWAGAGRRGWCNKR